VEEAVKLPVGSVVVVRAVSGVKLMVEEKKI
jgi:membrane protein implicated in regulation of membrane protease activity